MADAKEPIVLTIASFAVTKLAYVRLTKMFRDVYAAKTGADVRFRLTFAGSGVQVGGWEDMWVPMASVRLQQYNYGCALLCCAAAV